jgi:TfoX/Sxy family transcriptional regulator of competence genes
MAYDEGLAQRIRESLTGQPDLLEKQMFGGIGFMAQGNMVCGVISDSLIVRVGPDRYTEALAQPHTKEFDFTGRPMTGWVMVSLPGYEADESLEEWMNLGITYALSLPAK